MTKKPKKLLFSSYLYAFLSVVFLLSLFVYATKVDGRFFAVLAAIQVIFIIVLSMYRRRFHQQRAQMRLQFEDLLEQSNLVQDDIKREHQTIKSLEQKIINYSHLKNLTEELSLCLMLNDTSRTLCAQVVKLFEGRDLTAMLYLFHSRTGELGLSSSQKGQMKINIKSKKGDFFDEWVVKTMQPLLVENTKSDFRFDIEKLQTQDNRTVRSLASVPLVLGSKALGILRVDSPHEKEFDTEDLRFLTTVGNIGAVAIENAQLYEKLEELAIKDSLTGLFLRRYLLLRMTEEINRQLRHKKELSFLMIDLDKLKNYNDTYGHMAGDIVLKTIALLLQESFKEPGTIICRYGGEEFAVLLPDCAKDNAVKLAEEFRKKVQRQEIILRQKKTHMTVSIGVASFPKDAQSKEDLIHQADTALYAAKRKGRNKTCST